MMIIYCHRIEKILSDNPSGYLFFFLSLFYFIFCSMFAVIARFLPVFRTNFFLFGLERSALGNSEPKREGLSIVFSHD